MKKRGIVIGIVCILMLVNIPNVAYSETLSESPTGTTLASQFVVTCYTLYILAGFNLDFSHYIPDTELQVKIDFNVEKLNGRFIFEHPYDYIIFTVPPRHSVGWCVDMYREFMRSKVYFGIFKINVDLHVLDDDSHQYRTFYGVYIFPHMKIIFLGQFRYFLKNIEL